MASSLCAALRWPMTGHEAHETHEQHEQPELPISPARPYEEHEEHENMRCPVLRPWHMSHMSNTRSMSCALPRSNPNPNPKP